jgi:hypothetical protein
VADVPSGPSLDSTLHYANLKKENFAITTPLFPVHCTPDGKGDVVDTLVYQNSQLTSWTQLTIPE